MSLALQLLVNGLVSGGLLGVAALGVALIFGVMRVVNFAHGEFITLGAYATWLLVSQLHLSPLAGLPVAFVLGGLVGVIVQAVVLSRVTGRPELGLGLFAQGFGGDFRSYAEGPRGNLDIAGAIIGWRSLTVLLASVMMSGATLLVIQRTRLGLGLRALAQNRDSAATCGINVIGAERLAFGLASGLAAAAGCLVSMIGTTTPNVGHDLVLDAFVVVILGGMGSISGALVGALALGLVQSVVGYALDDSWSRMVAYLLLYLIILLRPQGLFGRAAA